MRTKTENRRWRGKRSKLRAVKIRPVRTWEVRKSWRKKEGRRTFLGSYSSSPRVQAILMRATFRSAAGWLALFFFSLATPTPRENDKNQHCVVWLRNYSDSIQVTGKKKKREKEEAAFFKCVLKVGSLVVLMLLVLMVECVRVFVCVCVCVNALQRPVLFPLVFDEAELLFHITHSESFTLRESC